MCESIGKYYHAKIEMSFAYNVVTTVKRVQTHYKIIPIKNSYKTISNTEEKHLIVTWSDEPQGFSYLSKIMKLITSTASNISFIHGLFMLFEEQHLVRFGPEFYDHFPSLEHNGNVFVLGISCTYYMSSSKSKKTLFALIHRHTHVTLLYLYWSNPLPLFVAS